MNSTDTNTVASNPLTDLTGFQRDLLVAISDVSSSESHYAGPSGQNIKTRAESSGCGHINHGRLYPNLDTLVEKELVEKGAINKRTNSYELSEDGKEALEEYAAFVSGSA